MNARENHEAQRSAKPLSAVPAVGNNIPSEHGKEAGYVPIRTRRWNDPAERGDGHRLLVCRYRPRGVRKQDETWDAWNAGLGPSRALHADFYGKHGPPISWAQYRRRYLKEMAGQKEAIRRLAERVEAGETITLLCSSACVDEKHCHRTLLARLIDQTRRGGTRRRKA